MFCLNVLRGEALQRRLVSRRHVVEVRVLRQHIEAVAEDRAIAVADHGFGVTAIVELPLRTRARRTIELADHAPVLRELILEVAPEQPRVALGVCGHPVVAHRRPDTRRRSRSAPGRTHNRCVCRRAWRSVLAPVILSMSVPRMRQLSTLNGKLRAERWRSSDATTPIG